MGEQVESTLRIAVAQPPAALVGSEARLAWLTEVLDEDEMGGADLLLLPELFQSGYNIGGSIPQRAEAADGPFFSAAASLAKRHATAITYGYVEAAEGSLFNSAICIDASGTAVGHHRKLVLPPGFEADHFSPGSGYSTFSVGSFTVAILICYDAEFPEAVRSVALMGAELVLVPTALGAQWGVVSTAVMPSRAFENGVFICYSDACGDENGMTHFGGSCIVGPFGNELARAGADPAILRAELRLSDVSAAQARLPYLRDRLQLPGVASADS